MWFFLVFFLDTSHEGDHQTQRAPFTTVVVYFCCNCGSPSDSLSLDARSLCASVPAKLSSSNQNKNEVNIGNIFVNVVSNFFGSQRYGFILGYSRSSLCRFFRFVQLDRHISSEEICDSACYIIIIYLHMSWLRQDIVVV